MTLRILSAHSIGMLATRFTSEDFKDFVKYAIRLSRDMHCSVRQVMSSYMVNIGKNVGREVSNQIIFPEIISLMEDIEEKVRAEAIESFCGLLDQSEDKWAMPALERMMDNTLSTEIHD